jgi:dGTPase
MVAFSPAMSEHDRTLKSFLFEHMYRHDRVTRMTDRARHVVRDLFEHYFGDPVRLPAEWAVQCDGVRRDKAARVVADYIAGMTDRYALQEHERFFGKSSE